MKKIEFLKGIDMEVRDSEFLAIASTSGPGKSTIMNLVGCLDLPSKGSVYLSGEDISEFSESKPAQVRGRKIGFIFQCFS